MSTGVASDERDEAPKSAHELVATLRDLLQAQLLDSSSAATGQAQALLAQLSEVSDRMTQLETTAERASASAADAQKTVELIQAQLQDARKSAVETGVKLNQSGEEHQRLCTVIDDLEQRLGDFVPLSCDLVCDQLPHMLREWTSFYSPEAFHAFLNCDGAFEQIDPSWRAVKDLKKA